MSAAYFDRSDSADPELKAYVEQKLEELQEPQKPGQYAVVLFNDDLNGVDWVTKVIKRVFAYPTRRAIWLMMKAHFSGSSVLWQGGHRRAVAYRNDIIAAGPDPNMVHKGARPLRVAVEKNSG